MAPPPNKQLSVVMFPFFAFGHITPYLHLSNRLAARGHRVAFLLPRGARDKVAHLNEHPDLITFHPIVVPHVEGLPRGAETVADIPEAHLIGRLMAAMDATKDQFRSIARNAGPVDYAFYDVTPWVAHIGRELGFTSVTFGVASAASTALRLVPSMRIVEGMTDEEMARTPPGYPSTTVVPRPDEIARARFYATDFGSVSFYDRIVSVISGADVWAVKTCREVEGKYCDYMSEQYGKPVMLTGPVLPKRRDGLGLEEKWASWLARFPRGSVVFCALGSETVLSKAQFQEYLRGFELCGRPFLAVLRPPEGCTTVEEAMPEGYKERVIRRGIVYGGWVPQLQILDHPSVGCFVSHCGYGSMWEALLTECQLLFIPNSTEHITITMLTVHELKVALEVEKDDKGWVSKEKLYGAIETVMDGENEVGKEVRRNHLKLREALSYEKMEKYVDDFVSSLLDLVNK